MGNSIKPHIERAEKTGACNLAKQGLTEFPEDLQRLTKNLRTLDLSDNKIPSVPNYIGSFSLLKNLALNNNRLTFLPQEIGNLKKLEALAATHNRINGLPSSLNQLHSLKNIQLAHNAIPVFPVSLCGLKNLDSVDLSYNKITEVPDHVKDLRAIELNLNGNQVSRLSEAIAECPRLKVLRVEENCLELTSLTPKIMKESHISLLAVDGNVFSMKGFNQLDGYDEYMERYTATKKKL